MIYNKNFLLCRPIGGLNDLFCQIEKCWQYAEKYNRVLIIDTLKSQGLLGQNFLDFFLPKNPKITLIFNVNKYFKFLNCLSCFPKTVQNRLTKWHYFPYRKITTFNFRKDYKERLLYHESTSGGEFSHKLLNRIKLNDSVKLIINKYLTKNLNFDYAGIHIRNTDLQSDFETFFETIRKKITERKILICTDNNSVIKAAKFIFNNSEILSNKNVSNNTFIPIHTIKRYSTIKERKKAVINSIIDLISLAKAKSLYISIPISVKFSNYNLFANIIYKSIKFSNGVLRRFLILIFERCFHNQKHKKISGFSNLALYLFKNKKIVKKLIST